MVGLTSRSCAVAFFTDSQHDSSGVDLMGHLYCTKSRMYEAGEQVPQVPMHEHMVLIAARLSLRLLLPASAGLRCKRLSKSVALTIVRQVRWRRRRPQCRRRRNR